MSALTFSLSLSLRLLRLCVLLLRDPLVQAGVGCRRRARSRSRLWLSKTSAWWSALWPGAASAGGVAGVLAGGSAGLGGGGRGGRWGPASARGGPGVSSIPESSRCVRVADRAGGAQARSLPNFNNPARLFPGTAGPSEPILAAVPDGALLPSVTLFALPGQAAQAAPIGTDTAPPGRRPLPGQSEQQSTNAHLVDLAAGGYRPDRRRTWDENVRTFVQTHQATCAGVRAGSCAGNCAGACTGRTRALGRPNAGMAFRSWAWPATFHIGRRGAAALAHLLQRPVWPMQQPPSSASRFGCSARAWA